MHDAGSTERNERPSSRHQRLAALRDRFIAANLRSRSLRLRKTTRSGALDLLRLHATAPAAWHDIVAGLGRRALSVAVADHKSTDPDVRALTSDLAALHRAAHLDEQLTGAVDLAVGWPILEGRGLDGTWLRAPLLLFTAGLEQTLTGKRQWRLRTEAAPLLNAPLAQAIDRACGVRITLDDLAGGDDDGLFALDTPTSTGLHDTLRKLGLTLNADSTVDKVQPLTSRSATESEAMPKGRFSLTQTLVLGRFPRAGSTIAYDYDALLAGTLNDDDLGAAAGILAIDDDLTGRIGEIGPLLGPGPAERPTHPHGDEH